MARWRPDATTIFTPVSPHNHASVPISEQNHVSACRTSSGDIMPLGCVVHATYSEDHIMERPGEKLKRVRERLKLTYRDVRKPASRSPNTAEATSLR